MYPQILNTLKILEAHAKTNLRPPKVIFDRARKLSPGPGRAEKIVKQLCRHLDEQTLQAVGIKDTLDFPVEVEYDTTDIRFQIQTAALNVRKVLACLGETRQYAISDDCQLVNPIGESFKKLIHAYGTCLFLCEERLVEADAKEVA